MCGFCKFNRIRKIWCSISGQYFCQHIITNGELLSLEQDKKNFEKMVLSTLKRILFIGPGSFSSHGITGWSICGLAACLHLPSLSCPSPCDSNTIFPNFLCILSLHHSTVFSIWYYVQHPRGQGPHPTPLCYNTVHKELVPIAALGPQGY